MRSNNVELLTGCGALVLKQLGTGVVLDKTLPSLMTAYNFRSDGESDILFAENNIFPIVNVFQIEGESVKFKKELNLAELTNDNKIVNNFEIVERITQTNDKKSIIVPIKKNQKSIVLIKISKETFEVQNVVEIEPSNVLMSHEVVLSHESKSTSLILTSANRNSIICYKLSFDLEIMEEFHSEENLSWDYYFVETFLSGNKLLFVGSNRISILELKNQRAAFNVDTEMDDYSYCSFFRSGDSLYASEFCDDFDESEASDQDESDKDDSGEYFLREQFFRRFEGIRKFGKEEYRYRIPSEAFEDGYSVRFCPIGQDRIVC
jgi:hypothetical protein